MINKNIIKYALVFFMLCFLTGCEKNTGVGEIIKYDIVSSTSNLDPQFATDDTAQLIIYNTFEGLFRQDETGTLVPAVAKRYDVSQDGLTYTFYLNETAKWSDGSPLTAQDFVFGFQRMFNPQALSPYVQNYTSFKNAEKILRGELDYQSLGVSAKDNHTLVIELESKNPFLIQLLTSTSAMPCKEQYVLDKRGKYGLDVKSILFNGPFYVKTWDNDKYILLRQNEHYSSSKPTIAGGVNLYIDRGDPKTLFLEGESDACAVDVDDLPQAEKNNFTIQSFDNITWTVIFNHNSPLFQNANLCKAILSAIDREGVAAVLPEIAEYTGNFIPPTMAVLGENFREKKGDVSYNDLYAVDARTYLQLALAELELKKLPKITIDIVDTPANQAIIPVLQRSWQTSLSSYINTNPITSEELNKKLKSGNFDLAIVPFSPTSADPMSMLEYFVSGTISNISGYSNSAFDELVTKSVYADEVAETLDYVARAEYMLINEGVLAPLYNAPSFYAVGKGVTGIEFSPFSDKVYFKYAQKME